MVRGIVLNNGVPQNSVNVYYTDPITGAMLNSPVGEVSRTLAGVFPAGYFEIDFLDGGLLTFSFVGLETEFIFLPDENPDAPDPYFIEVNMTEKIFELDPVIVTPDDDTNKKFPALLLAIAAYFTLK